jgi:ATP-dependent DNA helicase RecG
MRLDGMLRVDVPEIDPEAFREAFINAFCHRNYREYGSGNITIFKDRVEIRSPGLLLWSADHCFYQKENGFCPAQ